MHNAFPTTAGKQSRALPVLLRSAALLAVAIVLLVPDSVLAQDAKTLVSKKMNDTYNLFYVFAVGVFSLALLGGFVALMVDAIRKETFYKIVGGGAGLGLVSAIAGMYLS